MSHPSAALSRTAAGPAVRGCIGVFDSGVGGLTVLRALRQRLPGSAMVYVGDVAHAPYGERATAEVLERSERIVAELVARGANTVVVACNTATAIAIAALRERWPELHFIGVEPGIKPAAALSRTRRIAVMATPATAASDRLRSLIRRHAPGRMVHVQPCAGLAAVIERGSLDGPELLRVLAPICERVRAANVDTVVLGCTHYPLIAGPIARLLGAGVALVDTAPAVAARVAALRTDAAEAGTGAPLRAYSTGDRATIQRLLRECRGLEHVHVEELRI